MNLFIDTNVVMDAVACRIPFADSAIRVFQMKNEGYRLFVSDLTYANMAYSERKIMERDTYMMHLSVCVYILQLWELERML